MSLLTGLPQYRKVTIADGMRPFYVAVLPAPEDLFVVLSTRKGEDWAPDYVVVGQLIMPEQEAWDWDIEIVAEGAVPPVPDKWKAPS